MRTYYRARAAACLRRANETTNPDQRAALLEMAFAWMRWQEQAEKNAQADVIYETPPPRQGRAATDAAATASHHVRR
jgi:hypothetical protein